MVPPPKTLGQGNSWHLEERNCWWSLSGLLPKVVCSKRKMSAVVVPWVSSSTLCTQHQVTLPSPLPAPATPFVPIWPYEAEALWWGSEHTEDDSISPTCSSAGVGYFRGYCVGESPTPRMAGGGPMGVGSSGWLRPSFLGVSL